VASCAINAFWSFTTIVLNVITIQALRKTASLSKTLKTLLLSLVVSDLGVGLLAQPLYIATLVIKIDQSTLFGFNLLPVFFDFLDIFLAIHLHLRYQEVVTFKRIVALVISIWVLSSALSVLALKENLEKVLSSVIGIIASVCLIIAGVLCCKMHAVVRRHRNEINSALQVQQVAQNGKLASDARLKKTALATFYMYIVFLGCYVPYFCVRAASINSGESVLQQHLFYYFLTLMYLNSSLNPLVYCWKMRNIRQAVISVLRLPKSKIGIRQHLNLFKETTPEKQYVGRPFQEPEIKECCSNNLKRYYAFLYKKDIRRPNRKEELQSLCHSNLIFFNVVPCKKMAITKDLHSTLVVNCVFNAFLSSTTIMLNIITIQALRKASLFPRTLKILLLSLTISDLGVGLLVQPLYVAHLVKIIEQRNNNSAYDTMSKAYFILRNLFALKSFLGVVTLTVDRFLAIHLHLRYQELVTTKRGVAVEFSAWVLSASISFISLYSFEISSIISAIIVAVCIIITGLLYCKIYAAVRHHTIQIHALQVQQAAQYQNGETANAARLRKTALATFYVYLLFLVCYLPVTCVLLAEKNGKTALLSHLRYFTFTLAFVNSSLNPLIYCWKMRHIRQAVLSMLRNIFLSGRFPMRTKTKCRAIKYWLKFCEPEHQNKLSGIAFTDQIGQDKKELWSSKLKRLLNLAVRKAHIIQRQIFVSVSFLSVFVLTVDRFLAIHLHLRYQELVTHKRVVAVVVSAWAFRASITFLRQFYLTMGSLPAIIVVVCIITTGLLYCKI
ncbi:unnamed protein product, partial [Porites lobata]